MIITIFGFCPYGPVIIYRMGGGREEITWFSGGEDAGGGSVDFGEITWFSGGKMGGSEDFGEITWFSEREEGGGGNRSSPTESKGGILENRLPPIFPIPLDEKNDQSSSLHLLFSIYK